MKDLNVWVHNHNNIDNMLKNSIKAYFYRRLSRKVVLLVIEKYMENFLSNKYNCNVYTIPHPSFLDDSGKIFNGGNNIVFSPSSTYDPSTMQLLEDTAKKQNFILWAKGDVEITSENVIKRKYFEDYEDSIKQSSVIFIINKINYRVAGIMYEALSYGKTVIGTESLFINELNRQYPDLVYVVKDISKISCEDIKRWSNEEGRESSYNHFVENHSKDSIAKSFTKITEKSL